MNQEKVLKKLEIDEQVVLKNTLKPHVFSPLVLFVRKHRIDDL